MERLKRFCFTLILSSIIGLFGTMWVYGEEKETDISTPGELYAQAAVLADGETGRILWGENSDEPLAMASTTKIMTCLIAIENSEMDDLVTISEYAASMPDVQLDAVAGDTFRMEDMLYSLMLESHNDVAVAIAEHVGGSVEGFAALMNEKAKALGCEQTNFVTPNGLDAEGHYTTASELAKISAEAIKNEVFVKIINTPAYYFSNSEGTRHYQVANKNAFLELMSGAFGIKTGFTNDAGYCFVGALEQDGRTYISVVLGSGWPPYKNYKWQDTRRIMEYGLEQYSIKSIGTDEIDVGELEVLGGTAKTVGLKTDCQAVDVLMNESEKVSVKIIKDLTKEAPIQENENVGWVYYQIGEDVIERFPIYTAESMGKKTFTFCLNYLMTQWLGS